MNFFTAKRNKTSSSSVIKDMDRKQKRYESLVNVYSADLYRYAYWVCRDPEVSQDLVQETCLRAWKSIDSLLDEKSAKSWLFTILRRENARRFERKQLSLVDIDDYDVVAEEGESHYDKELIKQKIAALPMDYKEPLLLQLIAGFTADEIAEQLNLNKNTVLTRLFRAKNLLKTNLKVETVNNGEAHG
jgi:RNA polymerase sigma-70 factor (ECF subfamily)